MTHEGYEALHQRIREIHADRIARISNWVQPLGEDEEYVNVMDAPVNTDWEYPVVITEASLAFGDCRGDEFCRCRGCKPPLRHKRFNWRLWAAVFLAITLALAMAGK